MKRIVLTLILLSVMLMPAPTATAAPTSGWTVRGNHVVRAGETLFCIGRAYGVDPWAIAAQNGIINVNLIHPNVTLAIPNMPATLPPGPICTPQFDQPVQQPPTCSACTCRYEHLIVTGDTLFKIASLYNVDMQAIANCNCLYNQNYIRIGDKLCIP